MAIELSRMDFHVFRFMNSEDVQEMDASEVGQYCLLLFNAWTIAKDVTLPVELDKLARHARVDKISPSVLRKFPVVDTPWGKRRRNASQLEVWEAAKARTEAGKKGADSRWKKDRIAVACAEALPNECDGYAITEQNIPSIPEQAEQIESEGDMSIKNTIIDKSRAILGVRITPTDSNWSEVKALVRVYGEEAVSDKFEQWAKSQTQTPNYPLSGFVRVADALLSGKFSASVPPEDISALINELTRMSNNKAVFNNKHRAALAEQLLRNTPEDIKSAFEEYWGNVSGNDFKEGNAAREFTEAVESLLYTQAKRREDARRTAEMVARCTEQEQKRAAEQQAEDARRMAEESALIEDTLEA